MAPRIGLNPFNRTALKEYRPEQVAEILQDAYDELPKDEMGRLTKLPKNATPLQRWYANHIRQFKLWARELQAE